QCYVGVDAYTRPGFEYSTLKALKKGFSLDEESAAFFDGVSVVFDVESPSNTRKGGKWSGPTQSMRFSIRKMPEGENWPREIWPRLSACVVLTQAERDAAIKAAKKGGAKVPSERALHFFNPVTEELL